jgi:hypothetical protein
MSAKRKTEEKPMELAIAVRGEVITSNFEAYKQYAKDQITAISFDLKTDEDFDRAATDAKGLKAFETRLGEAKADFLAQMDEVNRLLESVDELGSLARKTRLELERMVKQRKEEVREGIVRDGLNALDVKSREFSEMITNAIKGKSSLVKMQEAVTEVVEAINERIATNREVFAKARGEHGDAVAYSEDAFVTLTVDSAKVEIERRIERHRAAIKEAELKAEADKLRKEKEEREAAEKAAQAAPPTVKESLTVAEADPFTPTPPAALPPMREETPAEEMETFLNILRTAFAPVKQARAALKHPANVARAAAFAAELGKAYEALTKEEEA